MNNEYNHDDFIDSLESKAKRNGSEVIDLGNNTVVYVETMPDDMLAECYNEDTDSYDEYEAFVIVMYIYYCGIKVGHDALGGIIGDRKDYILHRDQMIEEITSDSIKKMVADTVKHHQKIIERLTA